MLWFKTINLSQPELLKCTLMLLETYCNQYICFESNTIVKCIFVLLFSRKKVPEFSLHIHPWSSQLTTSPSLFPVMQSFLHISYHNISQTNTIHTLINYHISSIPCFACTQSSLLLTPLYYHSKPKLTHTWKRLAQFYSAGWWSNLGFTSY